MPFLTVVDKGAVPNVEFVGEIVAPQPADQRPAVITVWVVDDNIVLSCCVEHPVLTPAQCRQLADFMVAASRTCGP